MNLGTAANFQTKVLRDHDLIWAKVEGNETAEKI